MEKLLNYNFIPTLKEMAFRRIVVTWCNETDILKLITEIQDFEEIWSMHYRCRYISQILSNLLLPESLKKQMIPIIKAIADEILRWKLFHKNYLGEDIYDLVSEQLRWTTAGTVNYRETAEEVVRCDVLDVVKRFQLSCFYCLEDYIPGFWKELSDEDKMAFCNEDPSQIREPHLQLFMPKILEKAESNLSCYYRLMRFLDIYPLNNYFERAAALGNKTLADYCLRKLTEEERGGFLVQAAKNIIRYRNYIRRDIRAVSFIKGRLLSEVACHLLSLLTAEKEIGILKELPFEVLGCFADWPYQDLFLDMADKIWTFIPEREYEGLIRSIFDIFFLNPGYYFPNLIQEFFLRSPVNFRKCFVDYECRRDCQFITELTCKKDTETIRILLRNLEAADRERLVFTERVLFRIYTLTFKCPAVEVFLREATLTKEQKQRLKMAFMEYAKDMKKTELEINRNYRRFFEFVDESNAGAQRKSILEDEN